MELNRLGSIHIDFQHGASNTSSISLIKTPEVADDRSEQAELEALIEEARRRARRRRLGLAACIAGVLVVAGALVALLRGDEDPREAISGGASGGVVLDQDLLFLRVNTTPNLVSVNPQTGRTTELPIELPCGDTPYCLIPSGDQLVISGVGRTEAYDPSRPGKPQARRFGNGWITVPSTTPGTVWLGILKHGQSRSRFLSKFREVDLNGNTLRATSAPRGMWAAASVSGGLLFVNRSLRLWSFDQQEFTMRIPGRTPADTSGSLVASCDYPCERFAVTDTGTGQTTRLKPPAGYSWVGGSDGEFSADGAHLVLPISSLETDHLDALALVNVDTATSHVVPGTDGLDSQYRAITWATTGDRFFFVADPATIRSYRLDAKRTSAVTRVPVGQGTILQMVAVPTGA